MQKKKQAIILLSGGLDSATALYWALKSNYEVMALSINFFMRSPKEQEAIKRIVKHTAIKLIEVDIPIIKEAKDLEYDGMILPYGSRYFEGYVPQRNLIFYAIAAYYAEIYGIETIIGGHIQSDPEAFPDSSPNFFDALQSIINIGIPQQAIKIEFLMPFAKMNKKEVIKLAIDLKVPLENTWSCYFDGVFPCQNCVSCKERAKAFSEIEIKDPLINEKNTLD